MREFWKVLFIISLVPFVWPFLLCFYSMSVESWNMLDFLFLYSVIYWPTYILGLAVMILSVVMLKKK